LERVQFLVLTLPDAMRPRFEGKAGKHDFANCLRLFIDWARDALSLRWCYARAHPTGDDQAKFAPHWNLVFRQAQARGKLDVAAIRAAWAEALGFADVVDVHAEYANPATKTGLTRLIHHVRYIERPFPGWTGPCARWCVRLRAGQVDDADQGETAREEMTVDEETGEVLGGVGHVCPICGQPFVLVDPGPEDQEAIAAEVAARLAGAWGRTRAGPRRSLRDTRVGRE
jgi:hypothetical protein